MTSGTKRLLVGAAAVVAVSLGFLIEERVRGVVALGRWQAEMRAKGEKLTIAEIVPPAPTNMGCLILTPEGAASRWAVNSSSSSVSPPAMWYVAPGKAQVGWQAGSWMSGRANANNWANAAVSLQQAMPAIENLRADLTNHVFVVRFDYDQGFPMPLPHVPRYEKAGVLLKTATQLALRQQRLDLATENLVALAALADFSEGEGMAINEIVLHAIADPGVRALWEALQADGWSDAQLAAIHAAWQKPDFMRGIARAFEVERATSSLIFDRDRYSLRQIFEIVPEIECGPPGNAASPGLIGWVRGVLRSLVDLGAKPRYLVWLGVWRVSWMEQDQLRHQRLLQQAIDRMRRAASEKRFRTEPQPVDQGTPSSRDALSYAAVGWRRARYCISMCLLPLFERSPDKAALAEAQRDIAITALAIKRYQLRHGGLPDRLEALVPEFLPTVPRDWFADAPLQYRTQPDGSFLLYSVGPDGEDNGGDARPADGYVKLTFAGGCDLVWPQSATAAEIAAFEAGLR